MHTCEIDSGGICLRDVNERLFSYGVVLYEMTEMGSFSSCVEVDLRGDLSKFFSYFFWFSLLCLTVGLNHYECMEFV